MTISNCSNVFETTELRDHIFGFIDRRSLAKCNRVCSSWTESALDLVWGEMDDMVPLFNILAPMIKENVSNNHIIDERLVYDPALSARRNWHRFMLYGRRIKHFILNWYSVESLSNSALNEIARSRPSLSITPNLKTLSILFLVDGDYNACNNISNSAMLLLGHSITHITVGIPPQKIMFSTLADHVLLRVPNLESLELRVDSPMTIDIFEEVLSNILPGLKQLRTLRLPHYSLTSDVIRHLSTIPKLETIGFCDGHAFLTMPDIRLPRLKDAAYPSLVELHISCNLSQLAPFISTRCFGETLAALTIQVLSLETSETLRLLLEIMERSLPTLCRLTVNGIPQIVDFDAISLETMLVSGATLKPISDMKTLVELCMSWPTPFFISNRELESLASTLPRLKRLSFNSCPADFDEVPRITLDILPVLSNLCPDLRSLALYVDCSSIPDFYASVFASGNMHRPLKPFTKLREIDFGLSPLGNNKQKLSIRLSKVLPVGCDFKYRSPWLLGVKDIVERMVVSREKNRWSGRYKHLKALTEPLISVRTDERDDAFARIRELECRIRELDWELTKSSVSVRSE